MITNYGTAMGIAHLFFPLIWGDLMKLGYAYLIVP